MAKDIGIFLFLLGIILFNWPIMSIFKYNLSIYLFLAWFVFIVLVFISTVVKKKGNDGG